MELIRFSGKKKIAGFKGVEDVESHGIYFKRVFWMTSKGLRGFPYFTGSLKWAYYFYNAQSHVCEC